MKIEFLNKTISKAHNHLYANEGLSNSEALEELLKLMYCKIELEKNGLVLNKNSDNNSILVTTKETYRAIVKRFPNIFIGKINITDQSLVFIMKLFIDIEFSELKSDKKGHILQKVLDRSYRERNGQFFTPNPVVDFVVRMIDPKSHELGADPACGTGGFLFSALEYIYTSEGINALKKMFFFEISENISRLIRMRTLFEFDDEKPNLIIGDSLSRNDNCEFDYILSNPPFGSQGKITNSAILEKYELGRDEKTGKVLSNQVPDILFVEKIVKSLKFGGRAAIVLPDGDLENPSTFYLRNYLLKNTKINAIVSLPNGTFIPYGTGVKASIIFFTKLDLKFLKEEILMDYDIFFSKISKLGYSFSKHSKEELNVSGEPDEDYSKIIKSYKEKKYDDQSYIIKFSQLEKRNTFSYSYHSPIFKQIIKDIKKEKYNKLGELVKLVTQKAKIEDTKIYRYLEIADVNSLGSEIINSEELLGEDLPSRASYILKEDDLIVAIAGNAIGTKKHSKAIVTDEFVGCICTNGFAVLRTKGISVYYLLYFLNSNLFLDQIKKYRFGSAIPTISREDLLSIVVPIPDKETIMRIEKDYKLAYEYKITARKIMEKDYYSSSPR